MGVPKLDVWELPVWKVSVWMGRPRALLLIGMVLAATSAVAAWTTPGRDVTSYVSTKAQDSHSRHHTPVAEEESPPLDLTRAEALIDKQQFAEAEPLLRKVLTTDSANYVAWFDLGFVENALGKTDESIAAYRKSVAAKPDVFESNLNLGLQLAKTNHPDAEQFLRAATKLKPASHAAEGQERAWLSLAHFIEAQRPEEALAAYDEAAKLRPNDPEPHLSAASLLEKQNKFSDAEQEYKQAQQLDPASTDAITGLANLYMRARRFPEAETELRKLVQARPGDAPAHIQLARVLAAGGKNEEAITELESLSKPNSDDPAVARDLADLYTSAGKYAKAEATYRILLQLHPNDPELHQSLGQSLLRQKKFPEAQHELLTALKLKPDTGTAYGDLAFVASENKDYGLTLKALDARAKFLPEIPTTYFLRASAYDHLKDVKKAVANYHLFLEAAKGKYPDQEWQARHRLIALEPKK